jgi:hypothetical protein
VRPGGLDRERAAVARRHLNNCFVKEQAMAKNMQPFTIEAHVYDEAGGARSPIVNAPVTLKAFDQDGKPRDELSMEKRSDQAGRAHFEIPEELYRAHTFECEANAFGLRCCKKLQVIDHGPTIKLPLSPNLRLEAIDARDAAGEKKTSFVLGTPVIVKVHWTDVTKHGADRALAKDLRADLELSRGAVVATTPVEGDNGTPVGCDFALSLLRPESVVAVGRLRDSNNAMVSRELSLVVIESRQMVGGDMNIRLHRTANEATSDLALWAVIRKSCEAMSFRNYLRFIDHVLCGPRHLAEAGEEGEWPPLWEFRREALQLESRRFLPFTDSDSYRLLKVATEAFVTVNSGVAGKLPRLDQHDRQYLAQRDLSDAELNSLWQSYLRQVNGTPDPIIPYLALIRDKLRDVPIKAAAFNQFFMSEDCYGIFRSKLTAPCFNELIWSYWHEEAMVVQTINALCRRFQNVRRPGGVDDPLANLDIDPLRALNNLLWGLIQDEQHRLSVVRRNYEYDHHYGLRLEGRVTRHLRAADSRSKFLEAFHNLLAVCWKFFKQDDDTTYKADGFTVLNGLKEVHLILSHGAHNQFGDLPTVSRIEMLMNLWILARPEFREFLPGRIMTANPEVWIDRVDSMKKLQNWTDVSALHFRNLGIYGEQILASIRYGAWAEITDPLHAANWARFWRPQIQGYIHDYRVVTGADFTSESEPVDTQLPAVHLSRRLAQQVKAMTT